MTKVFKESEDHEEFELSLVNLMLSRVVLSSVTLLHSSTSFGVSTCTMYINSMALNSLHVAFQNKSQRGNKNKKE